MHEPVRRTAAVGSVWGRVRSALRAAIGCGAHWLHQFTGEGAYRAYVEHRRRTHPGEPVIGEREFWREKYAAEDANPGSRCC